MENVKRRIAAIAALSRQQRPFPSEPVSLQAREDERRSRQSSCLNRQPRAGFRLPWDRPPNLQLDHHSARGSDPSGWHGRSGVCGVLSPHGGAAVFLSWKITGEVPRSRGLGSSVTVRLGVLHGLNELAGSPLNRQEVFELCAELEGHPDNAAPAAFGGFTIARGGRLFSALSGRPRLGFALLIPDFEVSTSDARRVLPKSVPLGDAVISVSNACAIAGAFASRDYEKLVGCFDDRLHQPFRQKLVPFLSPVIEAGRKAGALGGWFSGSGSTVACVSLGNGERVAGAMLAACKLPGARVVTTRADNAGVRISVRS